jgi:hypothetical protein
MWAQARKLARIGSLMNIKKRMARKLLQQQQVYTLDPLYSLYDTNRIS